MMWIALVSFVGLLWISSGESSKCKEDKACKAHRRCFKKQDTFLVIPDNFNGVIDINLSREPSGPIVFLQKNVTKHRKWGKKWPKIEKKDDSFLLYLSRWHIDLKSNLTLLHEECNTSLTRIEEKENVCNSDPLGGGLCNVTCFNTGDVCKEASFDKNICAEKAPQVKNSFIINITDTKCLNCDNPVKIPEEKLGPDALSNLGIKFTPSEGEALDPVQAGNVMRKMGDLAAAMNTSSVALDVGEGIKGILMKDIDPEFLEEVSFAYNSPDDGLNIIEDRDTLSKFSKSVVVSKEAFEQASRLNVSVPFVAVMVFKNLTQDEMNSTILGNEVMAVDMGTNISNLTDRIRINFGNVKYEGVPSCQSWDGEGDHASWTDYGCETIRNGENITCQCSHLTFFAILLTPLNKTISSSDLKNLTIITQVGCSLSMLFLGIILFMHFLMRKTKASTSTRILIYLVMSMFFLDFTFLINHYVAKLKSSIGCSIMAAVMHYFLITTFTWFAIQGFHLCLQLYSGGKVVIRHYILKVCIISWALPIVIGVALLAKGKYGEQVIRTDDPEETVAMCWITDSNVHYIVNIGFYAVVFLITFTSFIIIVCWLHCLRSTKSGKTDTGGSGKKILTILGLCCMLGITWGFAFFAYGALLIPSYYIFTTLNSFQGFLLFIYYHNSSSLGHSSSGLKGSSDSASSSISTLKTEDSNENPYSNLPTKTR